MNVKEFVEALNSNRGIPQPAVPVVLIGFVKSSGSPALILFAPENACHNWIALPAALIEKIDYQGKRPCLGVLYDYAYIYLRFSDNPEGHAVQELLRTSVSFGGAPPLGAAESAAARGVWNCNAWFWLKDESFTRYHNFTVTANTHQEALVAADWTMRSWLQSGPYAGKWIRYGVNVSGRNLEQANRPQSPCERSASSEEFPSAQTDQMATFAPMMGRTTRQYLKCCFYEKNGQYAGSSISDDYDALVRQGNNWMYLHQGRYYIAAEPHTCRPTG